MKKHLMLGIMRLAQTQSPIGLVLLKVYLRLKSVELLKSLSVTGLWTLGLIIISFIQMQQALVELMQLIGCTSLNHLRQGVNYEWRKYMTDISRKLATVRIIADIQPIPGADFIEVVTVDGWKCVAKKGDFKVGDRCIYFEIDSYLPVQDRFEFLRPSSYRKSNKLDDDDGFRLRTIKLRKQISQGLAVPFDTNYEEMLGEFDTTIGADLTERLGVVRWDPPLPADLGGKARGFKPSYFPKTDQERIQNLPELLVVPFEGAVEVFYEETEKMDGTSMSAYRFHSEVGKPLVRSISDHGVCGRTLNFMLNNKNSLVREYDRLNFGAVLDFVDRNLAVQGELCGPGIQKNPLKLKEVRWFIFDIYDIDQARYFTPGERWAMMLVFAAAAKQLKVPAVNHVPISNRKALPLSLSMDELIESVERPSLFGAMASEGRCYKGTNGGPSFKVINNKYLLRHDS